MWLFSIGQYGSIGQYADELDQRAERHSQVCDESTDWRHEWRRGRYENVRTPPDCAIPSYDLSALALRAADEAVRLAPENRDAVNEPNVAILRAWVLICSGAGCDCEASRGVSPAR